MKTLCFTFTWLTLALLRCQPAHANWQSPTTLHIVLVSFPDQQPYGYTDAGAPGSDSYTFADFKRMLGASDEAYGTAEGAAVTLSNGEMLPKVYGTLKQWYDDVSGGKLELRFRFVNPPRKDDTDYPQWLQLDQTRKHYQSTERVAAGFLDNATQALVNQLPMWYPVGTAYVDVPVGTIDEPRGRGVAGINTPGYRRRHKLVFIYAGREYSRLVEGEKKSGIHPHASNGQYVVAEREQFDSHGQFTAIGIHVHELGHLLGIDHAEGTSDETNVYTDQTPGDTYRDFNGKTQTIGNWKSAALKGWGSMQAGAHGPSVRGKASADQPGHAFTFPYKSCPSPFNGFSMSHLGWGTHDTLTTSVTNHRIAPSPDNYYRIQGADSNEYILEFRTAVKWGQYTGWYHFDAAPGLLIWKKAGTRFQQNSKISREFG